MAPDHGSSEVGVPKIVKRTCPRNGLDSNSPSNASLNVSPIVVVARIHCIFLGRVERFMAVVVFLPNAIMRGSRRVSLPPNLSVFSTRASPPFDPFWRVCTRFSGNIGFHEQSVYVRRRSRAFGMVVCVHHILKSLSLTRSRIPRENSHLTRKLSAPLVARLGPTVDKNAVVQTAFINRRRPLYQSSVAAIPND